MRLDRQMKGCVFTFAFLIFVSTTGTSITAAEKDCPLSDDAFAFEPFLPKTLKALDSGDDLTVVAVGGASTEGRAAGGPEASWAARFVDELRGRFPTARIKFHLLASPRRTAAQMAERFARDVTPLQPTLVVWETGTVDAVRGTDIDEFRTTLQEGLALLTSARAEVVLMDMQYSRLSQAVDYFNRYVVLMRGVADVNDIPLFPRHKIMYDWAEMGLFESSVSTAEARRALADKLYRCIGIAVADFVTRRPEAIGNQQ